MQDLVDLPDVVFKDSLGGGRFFKTSLCLHDEGGLVVVKTYRIPPEAQDSVNQYEDALLAIRSALSNVASPHVWPIQRVYQSDRAVHLVRQYFSSTLASRMSSRPFLTHAEKRWLGFQLLLALTQTHDAGVYHGDIKSENVLLTSWGWALLSDWAPYKPTYLPSDNPADFSFFFDTSGRRTCYLAPERFYDSGEPPPKNDQSAVTLTPAMDVFAAGCVLAELFSDGEPLFDYSRLLAYRCGDYDPTPSTHKLDPQMAKVVSAMIERDPSTRCSAKSALNLFTSIVIDEAITEVMHPFMAQLLLLDGDSRAEFVGYKYLDARDRLLLATVDDKVGPAHDLGPTTRQRGKGQHSNQYANIKPNDNRYNRDRIIEEQSSLPYASLQQQAIMMIQEARAAVAGLGEEIAAAVSLSRTPTSPRTPSSTPGTPSNAPFDSTTRCVAGNRDGLVLLLGLLCSVIRGSRKQQVRVQLIHAISDCSDLANADEVRFHRVIPQLVVAATDPHFAAVRCAALQALPHVLATVTLIPPGEARAFADYLLPSLSLLPADQEPFVQAGYAAGLGLLAIQGLRALDRQQDGSGNRGKSTVHYDEELTRLRDAVERAVHDLLVGQSLEPKLSLLPHLEDLAATLGRRGTIDGLLPALLTLFNSREWEVRATLYKELSGLCPTLGPHGVTFLLPFLDRMLSDSEPAAVAAAADLVASLCDQGLLQQRHILAITSRVMDAGLLRSDCTAVRAAAVRCMASAAAAMPLAASRALLLPTIKPQLSQDPMVLEDRASLSAALEARAATQGPTVALAPASPLAPFSPPSTSYSILFDPHLLQGGHTSRLSAAIKQAQESHQRLLSADTDREVPPHCDLSPVSCLVSTAQRIITRTHDLSSTTAPPSTSSIALKVKPATSTPPSPMQPWHPRGVLVAHLAEHTRQVTRIAPLLGTPLFISASEDGTANVWDARRLERDITFRPRATYAGHQGTGIRAAIGLQDGTTVVTGDADGFLHAWKVERLDREGWRIAPSAVSGGSTTPSGPVLDLQSWNENVVVLSTALRGVESVDIRAPSHQPAWKLGYSPHQGLISNMCCEPAGENWIITGSSRGVLTLWDVRFLLPVNQWSYPTATPVEAMALAATRSQRGAPLVYVAAGKDEIAAWDASNGTCTQVIRLDTSKNSPEALFPVAPQVSGMVDPLARARQLGAAELRALAAPKPGFRALLPTGSGQLITGGTDCVVRCWECEVTPSSSQGWGIATGSGGGMLVDHARKSYIVVPSATQLLSYTSPSYMYSTRMSGQVPIIEEHPLAGPVALGKEGDVDATSPLDAPGEIGATKRSRLADRAAALCHQQTIVDCAKVEGHADVLLVTASMDGSVKVWR